MQFYFVTWLVKDQKFILDACGVKRRLISFYYIAVESGDIPWEDYINDQDYEIFLDSGAYSALTEGIDINIDEYIVFIKKWQHKLKVYAVLDVIGDPRDTYENQQYMQAQGLRPIPVFHYGEDFGWLERYIDEGHKYIALGGMVGVPSNKQEKWLDHLFASYLTNEQGWPIIKAHGFGLSSHPLMTQFPWFSLDNSAWVKSSRFSRSIFVPDFYRGRWVYDRPPTIIKIVPEGNKINLAGWHFPRYSRVEMEMLEFYCNEKGLTWELMGGDPEEREASLTNTGISFRKYFLPDNKKIKPPSSQKQQVKVNRHDLLKALELVTLAVGKKDLLGMDGLCLKQKTIRAYNGWIAVSAKIDTDFEGVIPGRGLKKFLSTLEIGEEIRLIADGNTMTIKSGSQQVECERRYTHEFPDLPIWRDDVLWRSCHQKVLDGIDRAKFACDKTGAVQISGGYVYVAGLYLICRYKLPDPAPFEMVLPTRSVRVLSKFKNNKLRRVARYQDHVIFDFGYFRAFSLAKSRIGIFEVGHFFEPFQNRPDLIRLPDEVVGAISRARRALRDDEHPALKVSIKGEIICFKYAKEEELFKLEEPCPKPINFFVNPKYLVETVKRTKLMGFRSQDHELYFKGEKSEYLLQMLVNQEEKK
jgi:DNA polymerase III sliding clamp (beta) subunit (PCNA family)